MDQGYAHPEKLVTTQWVADHLDDPGVRIVESNEDLLLYSRGHIPGAVQIDWVGDLNDPITRDYLNRAQFEDLMRRNGIANDTFVVFYGDKNNWWACYALWIFELFGHTRTAVMDGGRLKWEQEGRPMTREVPSLPKTEYHAQDGPTTRSGLSARMYWPTLRPIAPWWTCAAPANTPASFITWKGIRRRARCAPAISGVRSTCRGPVPPIRATGPSSRPRSCVPSTNASRA
jgi:hypothetical protein